MQSFLREIKYFRCALFKLRYFFISAIILRYSKRPPNLIKFQRNTLNTKDSNLYLPTLDMYAELRSSFAKGTKFTFLNFQIFMSLGNFLPLEFNIIS